LDIGHAAITSVPREVTGWVRWVIGRTERPIAVVGVRLDGQRARDGAEQDEQHQNGRHWIQERSSISCVHTIILKAKQRDDNGTPAPIQLVVLAPTGEEAQRTTPISAQAR